MGITNEERERHIRIANMLIGVITDLERPMLMYQIEKDVTKEALENYIKMLEQQPCEDVVSIGVFEQVKWERDVAIEQLEQLGYSLGEKIRTSEDCISREQTLKAFAEKCGGECACCEYNGSGYDNAENCKLIKSMPSVTPSRLKGQEPRQGHWIKMPLIEAGQTYSHKCSLCGRRILTTDVELSEFPYCHCGADMRESEESE